MTYSPTLSLIGGLQGPELLFLIVILLGGFLFVGATLFFIFRAAMKSALKSNQRETKDTRREKRD
jgi:uncharacterized protein YneF (UPF0154 family)